MNEPLPLTDEEGVRLRDGQVVHGLRALKEQHRLDFARVAIQRADVITGFKVSRVDSFAVGSVEGMARV